MSMFIFGFRWTIICLVWFRLFVTLIFVATNVKVASPNLDDAVFCRVNETIGEFQLESAKCVLCNDNESCFLQLIFIPIFCGRESILMERGNIYIIRYSDIQKLLEIGHVDLI